MSNKENRKPISILRKEFVDGLSNLINNCQLPPFMIEDIVKGVYLEVKNISDQQTNYEIEEYKKQDNENESDK